jgi:curved DNA-binding protein
LTIPPRTNANQTFRLRGKGMPYLRESNKRGDMFARVRLVLPDALTDQEVDSIRTLASARQKHAKPNEVQ